MARVSYAVSVQGTQQIDGLDDLTETLKWFHALLPQTALEELQKEQARGNLLNPVTIVDGKKNDNIQAVKLFGEIRYVESQGPLAEAILAADVFVRTEAPHKTGHYYRALQWFRNGHREGGAPNPARVGIRGNVQLVDLAPYASVLEIEIPRGIIFGAFNFLSRRFGRQLNISFHYAQASEFGGFIEKPGNPAIRPYAVPVLTIGNALSTVGSGARGRPGIRGKRRRRAGQ